MEELFGLRLSTAAASGHLRWFNKHFHPVVQKLLALLRESPVVHADETGWRIDGRNVWCWCFSNPKLAVFLDEPHVPPDNNPAERDIRSVAAARSDGGVNRTAWGAAAFAVAKSIHRTCRKNGINFFSYAHQAIAAITTGQPPPLPFAEGS